MPENKDATVEEKGLLDLFGELLKFLRDTDEKIPASDVAMIVAKTIELFCHKMIAENPMLKKVFEMAEMTLTTSIIMSISDLTSKREEVRNFVYEAMHNVKPN